MKLHLGCGPCHLDGWENHDTDMDIRKSLPFADGSVEVVFAEHLFEHVDTRDGYLFLKEAQRILVPGGVLRLCVPCVDRINKSARDDEYRRWWTEDVIINHGHRAAYTEELLKLLMETAGFVVSVTGKKECDRHVNGLVDFRGNMQPDRDDQETLRIEGMKPT